MHQACRAWVSERVREHGLQDVATLEIGSYRENGDPIVSDLFSDYVGVDMRPGPNVDVVVAPGGRVPGRYRCVLCLNTLEHDPRPWLTTREMHRVLMPGGIALVSVPDIGFPRHDHPSDYWRFTDDGTSELMQQAGFKVEAVSNDGQGCWSCHARK